MIGLVYVTFEHMWLEQCDHKQPILDLLLAAMLMLNTGQLHTCCTSITQVCSFIPHAHHVQMQSQQVAKSKSQEV